MRRPYIALLIGIWVFFAVGATLSAVRPPSARGDACVARTRMGNGHDRLDGEKASGAPRFARHLLLVVVNGLRWDVANDEQRMPRFAGALRSRLSGELWAGRITMTSSAVLSFGTGQRGELDQILENLHPPLVGFNDWPANAKRAGLRLMGAGDRAWVQLYGKSFDEFRLDPQGIAIDRDFNAQTFRNARELQLKSPDFLVAHFTAPDHQAHAYGIQSSRYARHIRQFDGELFDWLDSLTPDWTVVVTSDHGAADSGTHGTDTALQRRCPIAAWGPGIIAGGQAPRTLDQVEMPGLLSALLGVPTAEQSRGSVPFAWLDADPQQVRTLACREVERLSALTRQHTQTPRRESGAPSGDCVQKARQLASLYDRELAPLRGGTSNKLWWRVCLATVAALLAALLIYGKRAMRVTGVGFIWLLASLTLTYGVERLPSVWPNVVRALLFLVAAALLLALAARFQRWAPQLERHWALTLSMLPGWLLVSYSANAQVAAYAIVIVSGWLLFREGGLRSMASRCQSRGRGWPALVALFGSFALLAMPGTRPSDVCPAMFTHSSMRAAVIAGIVLTVGFTSIFRECERSSADPISNALSGPQRQEKTTSARFSWAGASVVLLSFALRHLDLSWVGRIAWIGSGLCAAMALVAGSRRLALMFGIASYTWVSRDYECLVLVPSLLAAAIVGRRSLSDRCSVDSQMSKGRMAWRWLDITFLFALSYIQWVGLQGGLQLTTMDFAAGTFGDAHVPSWLIGVGLAYKFGVAEVILLAVYMRGFPHGERLRLLAGLIAVHLAKGVTLLLMLTFCGHSYWTAFRVVADLPFALAGLVAISVVYAFSVMIGEQPVTSNPRPAGKAAANRTLSSTDAND